ncbi:family 20 glycosylhydrolase [Allokutzneria sp. A3M-2-11 16]|uniref:family 20 glycosylhydrolase n=1 Tax=Allokutzneria sp. A3M-2-11 16 TaxID=2962043 RepID=UPI00273A6690|nr:family 20 glycosylhydrolase [Allokutzneria sp. A3M-2-11 16]
MLTSHGGSTQVGGGPGGFYTHREFTEIVEYAAARHVTDIPEIDGPATATPRCRPTRSSTATAPPRPCSPGSARRPIGWHELRRAEPPVSAVPQFWGTSDTEPSWRPRRRGDTRSCCLPPTRSTST